jgi:hypothetical protein
VKRKLIVLAVVATIVIVASTMEYNGPVAAVAPDMSALIQGGPEWYARPLILSRVGDPDGIYVVAPGMPQDNQFELVRVSLASGAQRRLRTDIAPPTGFRDCLPVDAVRAAVTGVRVRRPAFHLLKFPSGEGPGFHRTDSATGRIDIVFDYGTGRVRRLLTERAYNSDNILELVSSVNVDRERHWIATTIRQGNGWMLFGFRAG